jgi:hypothetical protein
MKYGDRVALDRIHAMMSGRRWDGAADLLEAIAAIVERTGRKILPADDTSPAWNDETRYCEAPRCTVEKLEDEMWRMPDGSWYCEQHGELQDQEAGAAT